MTAPLKPGDRVRVREDYPLGHIRTPVYIRGKLGVVVGDFGSFGNPETLAYCLPTTDRELYKVRFMQRELWPRYSGNGSDSIELDIYEHWLEKEL